MLTRRNLPYKRHNVRGGELRDGDGSKYTVTNIEAHVILSTGWDAKPTVGCFGSGCGRFEREETTERRPGVKRAAYDWASSSEDAIQSSMVREVEG